MQPYFARAVVVLMVGLVVAAQIVFADPAVGIGRGVSLVAGAAMCLVWLMGTSLPGERTVSKSRLASAFAPVWSRWRRFEAAMDRLNLPIVPLVLAALFATLTLRLFKTTPPNGDFSPVFGLWLLSVSALGLACRPAGSWFTLPSPVRVAPSRRHVLLGAILLLALVLRVCWLDSLPRTVAGDEGNFGTQAMAVLDGRIHNMFGSGIFGSPSMAFFYHAEWMRYFGRDVVGLRVGWGVLGAASVLATYAFARSLFGWRLALAAAGLLAAYDFHVHYSRMGLPNVADTLFAPLCLWLAWCAGARGRRRDYVLTGLAMGLSQYFWLGGRLIPLVVAAYFLALILHDWRYLRDNFGNLALAAVAYIVTALPLLEWFRERPDEFMARMNQTGILQTGWLSREIVLPGKSLGTVVLEQVLRATLAFNVYPDRSVFYGPDRPLLDAPSAVLFTLGLLYALLRLLEPRYLVLVAWFGIGTLVGSALTDSPPQSSRYVVLAPLASLLVVLGLAKTLELARRAFGWPRRVRPPVMALVVAGLMVLNVRFYFTEYLPRGVYASLNAEVATDVGRFLRPFGADHRLYFAGPPRMGASFPTIPFFAPQIEGVDINQPISDRLDVVSPGKHPIFILLPERLSELAALERLRPGGRAENFYRANGQLLFTAYLLADEPAIIPR